LRRYNPAAAAAAAASFSAEQFAPGATVAVPDAAGGA